MFDKTRFDDAVSPVVGVILMVAVTVILAAVIGSFVLDLGSNVEQNPSAGVSIDQSQMDSSDVQPGWDADEADDNNSDTGVKVTVQAISVESADTVYVRAADNDASQYWDGSAYAAYEPQMDDGSDIPDNGAELSSAGDSVTIEQLTPGDKVTVVGELNGKEAVLQTHTVE